MRDDGPEAADLVVAVDDEFGLVGAGAGDDDVAVLAGAEEQDPVGDVVGPGPGRRHHPTELRRERGGQGR